MKVNVKLPPGPSKEHPHLTRFQMPCPPHLQGSTLLGIACEPSDTVAELKAKVGGAQARCLEEPKSHEPARARSPSASLALSALCGETPLVLRKGGGGGKGVPLDNEARVGECGLPEEMGVFEHLWADSEANQTAFWAEYEKARETGQLGSAKEEALRVPVCLRSDVVRHPHAPRPAGPVHQRVSRCSQAQPHRATRCALQKYHESCLSLVGRRSAQPAFLCPDSSCFRPHRSPRPSSPRLGSCSCSAPTRSWASAPPSAPPCLAQPRCPAAPSRRRCSCCASTSRPCRPA